MIDEMVVDDETVDFDLISNHHFYIFLGINIQEVRYQIIKRKEELISSYQHLSFDHLSSLISHLIITISHISINKKQHQ